MLAPTWIVLAATSGCSDADAATGNLDDDSLALVDEADMGGGGSSKARAARHSACARLSP